MLQKNPLQPPRPFVATPLTAANSAQARRSSGFLAADDFDATGIMAGVDPSESRYWWLPELYGPDAAQASTSAADAQATNRTGSRTAAAA